MLKDKKNIILICLMAIVLGVLGSFLFHLFVFPYMLQSPYFADLEFIKNFKDGKIVINPKEEIIVNENIALQTAIEKVEKTIVAIQAKTAKKNLWGSGIIITSDGLIVVLNDLVPVGGNYSVFLEGEEISPQVLKRDPENNLALLKVSKTGLKTSGFSNFEKIKKGERIFLVGIIPSSLEMTVNEGIIKNFNEKKITTNMTEENYLQGSPLFNIEGFLVGLSMIDSKGRVSVIPITEIKNFTGF